MASTQTANEQLEGTIAGRIVDQTGAVVGKAAVQLSGEAQSASQIAISDALGQFSFSKIAPGSFLLTISSEGFAAQTYSGILQSGEHYDVPVITLVVASASSQVQVTLSRADLAEAEIKDQEKQRIFGVVPNFYVTYNPAAVPLRPKQKFELAGKAIVDPVNLGLTGTLAGFQQATNAFSGYGQGAQGYAKRYAANYADMVTGTLIGSAILPTFLRQDPRYFYKGSGSIRSRIFYALASSVIRKSDNGQWQPDYSGIGGGLAAGEISTLYYPKTDRRPAQLMFENTLIGIGATAAANLLQEFLIRNLTPHAPRYARADAKYSVASVPKGQANCEGSAHASNPEY
ncbi:MAG TPA: carboxypeptidase-like regulatory domain-containing protein [Candidatus Acidoferrum sp.]|nr:carboxypeptidase-like regulatory domain-containing protein [Candidatus Acidoferrum sp.]